MSGLKKLEDGLIKAGQAAVDGIASALSYTDALLEKGRKRRTAKKRKPATASKSKSTAAKKGKPKKKKASSKK